MNRFVKTWMLWMLMLALPMQALASVAQLSCEIGGGHQRQPAYAAKAGHGLYARQALRLKHGAKAAKQAGAMPESGHAACGPCAAGCCASAALPTLPAAAAPWGDAELHRSLLPASHAGYVPDGLERPPRHHA
jgi:hypothetical protein